MSEDNDNLGNYNASESSLEPKKSVLTIKKTLVYTGIVLILIIIGFVVIMAKLINENSQCTSNPFVYGAARIESSQGEAHPLCACKIDDGTFCACAMSNGGAFWFDEDKMYSKNPLFDPNSGRDIEFTSTSS